MNTHPILSHTAALRPAKTILSTSFAALLLGALGTGPAQAVDLVTNGDFSANAAAFTNGNGYFNEGGVNPASAPNWTTTGSGINGTSTTTSNAFAPANNVPSFLFMQGDVMASQALGTVGGTNYLFSFDAAARNGNTAGISAFADNTQAASLVIDGSLGWLSQNAFQRYAFGFTATGAQTIQFNSSGTGDHTTDLTKVSVTAAAGGQLAVSDGTLFFTETSGTYGYGFALTGNNQTIYRRPGSATYAGNITTDGSGGALTFTANENAGTNNLTFSGSMIAMGAKNFTVTGQNVDSEGEAANTRVTLTNATFTSTTGNVEVGRGTLEIAGSTGMSIGGQLKTGAGGDWSRFVMNAGTSITASGGVNFRANGVIASSMYLNGGTLTTSSITGNDFGGGHTVFNGTTVIASAASADFLDVHLNGSGAAHSAAALVGNGGAIFDTNGNNIAISNTLANFGGDSGSLTKQGGGTLTLSTANTFSGATSVAAGTLSLTNNLALQNSALDTSGAGRVALSGTTPTFGGLKGGANLASVITTGYGGVTALTLNPGNGNVTNTYSGNITDGAAGMTLTKTGAGTQILSGANTYTGATTIAAGTLTLKGTATSMLLTDNFSATGNPNTLDLNYNLAARQTGTEALQNWTPAGNVQVGNPTPVQQPAGTNGDYLLLAFGGSATLNGMPLSAANAPGPLKVSFDMFKGNTGNSGEWTSFTMRSSGGNGFPITGSGEFGFLYRQNTGIQIFNNGGAIDAFSGTTGGDSFGFYLADSAGTGSPFAGNGTRLIVTQGGNTLGSYTLNTGMGTSYLTFGSGGGMIGGVDNLAVTQATGFQSNVLNPAAAVALTTSGATLQLTDVNQTVASLSGVAGTSVKIAPFSRLTVNGAASTVFDGVISGAGNLTKTGAGMLTLTATSTYTGSTTVSGGTLRLGGNIAPVSVSVLNAGFENTGSLGGGGWAYGPTGADWSFAGGTGISSNNQPWVNTAPEGTHAGFLQNTSLSQVLNFASTTTYDFSFLGANRPGYNPTGLLLQVDGVTVSALPAEGFQTGAAFQSYSFAAIPISAGSHSIAFVANNTFGGDTATAIDAISISSPVGALPSGTALRLTAAGAVVDLNGHAQTIGSLAGVAGTTVQNIAAFTVGGDGTSTSFAGAISGPGSLKKVGAGSLTLSGALAFPTLTTSGGVTDLNSALGTGASTINANATLNIHASQNLAALNIADGVEVTFGDGSPLVGGSGKFGGAAAVPEPASATLMLGGLAALLGWRRRKA